KDNPVLDGRLSLPTRRSSDLEAIDYLEKYLERGEKDVEHFPVGNVGTFNRQTDLAWDAHDNIFVADGYNNSRVVKLGKDGSWIKDRKSTRLNSSHEWISYAVF